MKEANLDNNERRPQFSNLLKLVGVVAVGLVDARWLLDNFSHLNILQVGEDSVIALAEIAAGGVVGYIGGLIIDQKLETPKN